MTSRILLRRGTAAQWASANPILGSGELGVETDTLKFKIGNGTSTWTQLTSYANITPSDLTSAINGLINAAPSALDTLNELAAAINNDSSFSTTVNNLLTGKVSKSGGDTITSSTASTIGLIVKATASQTANLQEWQDSAGNVLSSISSSGSINLSAGKIVSFSNGTVQKINLGYGGNYSIGVDDYTTVITADNNASNGRVGIRPHNATYGTSYVSPIELYANGQIKQNLTIASNVGLIIKGAASQTAALQQWQDSAGTLVGAMQIDGSFKAQYFDSPASSGSYMQTSASNGLQIINRSASHIPLRIRGFTSQSSNLQEWQNSSQTALRYINSSGAEYVNSSVISSFDMYSESGSNNTMIAIPNDIWADKLRFRTGTYEYSADGSTSWTAGTFQREVIDGRNDSGVSLATTNKGHRWVWNSADIAWSFPKFVRLTFSYTSPVTTYDVTVEASSDGTTWASKFSATGVSASNSKKLLTLSGWAGESYVRVTLVNNANTNALPLRSIEFLSYRPGDQGGAVNGIEENLPLNWNSDKTVVFQPIVATGTAIVAKGFTSQTASIQEWQSSAGSVLAKIDSAGVQTNQGLVVAAQPAQINNTVFGFNIIPTPLLTATTYWKIATLPTSTLGTYDAIYIEALIGGWLSNNKTRFEILMGNRDGFTYKHRIYGPNLTQARILAYTETNGEISVYLYSGNTYTTLSYNISLVYPTTGSGTGATIFRNPTGSTTAPTGTLAFDSSSGTYAPLLSMDNSGNSLFLGNVAAQNATNPRVRAIRTAATAQTSGLGADSGVGWVGSETNTPFQIITNNTARVTVDTSGNVGIGTTTMTGKLNVTGTSGGISGYFTDAVNSSLVIKNLSGGVTLGTDGGGGIHLATNGADSSNRRLSIDSAGKIIFYPTVSLSGTNAQFIIYPPSTAQGITSGVTLYSTFTGTADNGPRRTADIVAGYTGGDWTNEYLTFNVGYGGQNDVANLTLERMRISGLGIIKFSAALAEAVTVYSLAGAATTVTYDVLTNKNVLYYTGTATANWTFNVRGSATVTLNTLMDIGQSLTVVFMNTNGTTAYYPTAFQIDGTAVTPKWFGGTAPSAGNASSVDVYTYNIIKTASATYTVLASQSRFA